MRWTFIMQDIITYNALPPSFIITWGLHRMWLVVSKWFLHHFWLDIMCIRSLQLYLHFLSWSSFFTSLILATKIREILCCSYWNSFFSMFEKLWSKGCFQQSVTFSHSVDLEKSHWDTKKCHSNAFSSFPSKNKQEPKIKTTKLSHNSGSVNISISLNRAEPSHTIFLQSWTPKKRATSNFTFQAC